MRFALGLCAFVTALSCASRPPALDAIAEGYVRAALELSQHDPSLVEQWRGPESWHPGPRRPVAEIQRDVDQLQLRIEAAASRLASGVDAARARYLAAQIRALRYAVGRQLGRAASVDEQARDEFNAIFPPLDRSAIARAHQQLAQVVPGKGVLADRVLALRQAATVPRERRLAVLTKALDACRHAVPAAIVLPDDERVDMIFKADLPWHAFARYQGQHRTDLEVHDDSDLDVSTAFRLACHEGYPGHHVQHLLIDRLFGERQWPELLLTPGFGTHLLLTEGAAEVAADLALTAEQRVALYRDVLLPIAGLDAAPAETLVHVDELLVELLPVVTAVARDYLAGAITRAAAVDRLKNEALVANPDGTVAFIERRRARALVYGEGRRVIQAAVPARDLAALFDAFRRVAAVE